MPSSASSSVTVLDVPWSDPRASALRDSLDAEMSIRYGIGERSPEMAAIAEKAFFIDPATMIETVLLLVPAEDGAGDGAGDSVDDGVPVATASLRDLNGVLEVKRVIVAAEHRGRGLSRMLMAAIEERARRRGAGRLILQTGDQQPEAVALYESLGYVPIPVYEPYTLITRSLCFEKSLP
ncbi:GNAT family N-acetyltransferase [Compostimonas suwonensis]|uniref:Ribosomal protein S18 acetylase RimI-like enzyme n=1 Tax=Compostimonas suwonensis TaxID=1048394 RepID=A0A2M9BVX0_9MICO|nr:GNAT family N-acetyltransferase [Compostimonas suwonensis]PJJ62092.1 ribosomal protein S18 acetylase RimI-like enzyme [Compostimonas suwonensis]